MTDIDVRTMHELIHSCLDIFLMSVVWIYDTFGDNFVIKHLFTKCLRYIVGFV